MIAKTRRGEVTLTNVFLHCGLQDEWSSSREAVVGGECGTIFVLKGVYELPCLGVRVVASRSHAYAYAQSERLKVGEKQHKNVRGGVEDRGTSGSRNHMGPFVGAEGGPFTSVSRCWQPLAGIALLV